VNPFLSANNSTTLAPSNNPFLKAAPSGPTSFNSGATPAATNNPFLSAA
jgi:hypothetical protein